MNGMFDGLHEECGVVGVFEHPNSAFLTTQGLHALQHRGQEGTGVASKRKDGNFCVHRGRGLVSTNFTPQVLQGLVGQSSIGHVRYSTSGDNNTIESARKNIQPFYGETAFGRLALAHNGNLVNAEKIRGKMIKAGHIFYSTSDSEVLLQLIARDHGGGQIARIIEGLKKVRGGYSVVILTKNELIGVRDPYGIRPLVLGKLHRTWVLASETCAFDIIGARFVREIEPGEMVIISKSGVRSLKPFPVRSLRECDFEGVYFAHPNSIIGGRSVQEIRIDLGKRLARSCPVEADMVCAIPDSGTAAALGFSRASGIPFDQCFIRSHYAGRVFITPEQLLREMKTRLKLSVNRLMVKDKRVVVIDDSIVRGITNQVVGDMLWNAGAKEIHLRISCPRIKYSCFYGVDTPDKTKLLANQFRTVEKMRQYLGVTSLGFLPLVDLQQVLGKTNCGHCGLCSACFTGKYPI